MKDQEHQNGKSGFNRRDFLRGSGAAAAATALATAPQLAFAQAADDKKVVRDQTTITLNVNGGDHKVIVEPRTTLLEAIRYQLKLTGAKPVSPDGVAGAATVLVDGKAMNADTLLALECAGKKVRTVESLGGEKPDAVPAAFVHNDAQQCGFCTPGFVVAVRAFLNAHPQATEAEIRHGLNGNICRCGTYANVIQAAMEVVKGGSK
ncbi:MAG: (2Fe-2S)-binding protein [Planctomycetia bacterium]|nr:(2Fe-2S)-binding protein [Planctomycetia bacterium]